MSLCNWVFPSWQTYKITLSKPVKHVNDYNFIAKCLWCTTSSVFTHHSRNAESYHSMQQNNLDHFTEGENHNVNNAACCFEFVPRRAGSTCGGGGGVMVVVVMVVVGYVEIKILPGIMS